MGAAMVELLGHVGADGGGDATVAGAPCDGAEHGTVGAVARGPDCDVTGYGDRPVGRSAGSADLDVLED